VGTVGAEGTVGNVCTDGFIGAGESDGIVGSVDLGTVESVGDIESDLVLGTVESVGVIGSVDLGTVESVGDIESVFVFVLGAIGSAEMAGSDAGLVRVESAGVRESDFGLETVGSEDRLGLTVALGTTDSDDLTVGAIFDDSGVGRASTLGALTKTGKLKIASKGRVVRNLGFIVDDCP
jgi:hypothetical protein